MTNRCWRAAPEHLPWPGDNGVTVDVLAHRHARGEYLVYRYRNAVTVINSGVQREISNARNVALDD
jgi:hypothetical protein